MSKLTRRNFVGGVATTGLAAVPSGLGACASSAESGAQTSRENLPKKSNIRIGLDIHLGPEADVAYSDSLMTLARQLDVEWVATPLRATQGQPISAALTRPISKMGGGAVNGTLGGGLGGPSGPWTENEVRSAIQRAESKGLRIGALQLHSIPNILLGNPERDRDIEHVQESIRIAGRLDVPVVQYSFIAMPPIEGLYTSPGRGGSTYRAFDSNRLTEEAPLPALGTAADQEMWGRLKYFLTAVVPVAEQSNVRLALHPNDPPVPAYRGVAQPFDTLAHWKRVVNYIASPANGIVMDTGVTTEIGGNVIETIRYFGARNCINHVHFRNVHVEKPVLKYTERFIDEGDTDMLMAMRALQEVGYSGMLVPDHSPVIAGDTNQFGAWGYALGFIKALLQATG